MIFLYFFFFFFLGTRNDLCIKKESKVRKTYSSTSTSFSHNNGMEGEDLGLKA